MASQIKDIKETKDQVITTASKGFKYYVKNVLLIALVAIAMYIISHPDVLINPKEFFSNFTTVSIWGLFIVFVVAGGIYQVAKSISSEERMNESKEAYKKMMEFEKKQNNKEHNFLVQKRFDATSAISNKLKEIIIDLGADRVTLCEMHNGTNNLSGLPFVFLSMTSEEISPGQDYVSDEFRDFNLAKFPFIANHFKEGSWIGTLEKIEKEDPYFAAKLKLTKASTIALMILRGKTSPIGVLTVAFNEGNEDIPPKAKIIAEMAQQSQVITAILDDIND